MSPARKSIDLDTYEGRIAWRLRALRKKAGLTVEEAAEQIGIAPTTVYSWEIGANRPNILDLPKISEIYKVKKAKDLLPNE